MVGRAQQNLGLGPGLKAGPDILRKVDSSYMFVLRTQLEHTLNLRENVKYSAVPYRTITRDLNGNR